MAVAEFLWFVAFLLLALAVLRIAEAYAAHAGWGRVSSGIGWFIGV